MIDFVDIVNCTGCRGSVPVNRREGIAIAFEGCNTGAFAMCSGKGVGQVVRPVARGFQQVGFDIGDLFGEGLAGLGFNDEMQPRQNFI